MLLIIVQGFEKAEMLSNEDVAEHLSTELPEEHSDVKRIDEGQREEWREIYDDSARRQFVSAYARTNEREDFAESYKAYVHDPERLKRRSLAKYKFMHHYVFKGREYR